MTLDGHARAEVSHHYGPRVHWLQDPWSATALARVGTVEVPHTELLALVRSLYSHLCGAALARELATIDASIPTRGHQLQKIVQTVFQDI
jgi:hypothetical protein